MAQISGLTRRVAARLRSVAGAIDLASIMVGVLVMGILGSLIAAAVFVVIPWSQDSAARSSLDAVRTAEGVHMVKNTGYGDLAALTAAKYLPAGSGMLVGTNAAGDCYVGVSRSKTGVIYYQSDRDTAARVYGSGSTSSCTDLPTLINPMLVAGGPGGATPIVNLATNPSFEASGPAVTVRTNLSSNPKPSGGVGWSFANANQGEARAATMPVTGGSAGGQYYRATVTAVPANMSNTGWTDSPTVNVTAGNTYTASAWVRNSVTRVVQLNLVVNGISETFGPATPVAANVWTRISSTWTVPASGVLNVRIRPQVGGAMLNVGEMLDADRVLVEESQAVGTYFDGASAASSDLIYTWAGAANASASVGNGVGVPGAPGQANYAAVYQSSAWAGAGASSARISPTTSRVDTFVELPTGIFVIGKTYTVLARAHLNGPQSGTLDGRARSIMAFDGAGYIAAAPNAAGDYDVRITFTLTGTLQYLRLYNGANDSDMWWDNLTIVEGPYSGPTFDGSSSGAYWLGAPNASESLRY